MTSTRCIVLFMCLGSVGTFFGRFYATSLSLRQNSSAHIFCGKPFLDLTEH